MTSNGRNYSSQNELPKEKSVIFCITYIYPGYPPRPGLDGGGYHISSLDGGGIIWGTPHQVWMVGGTPSQVWMLGGRYPGYPPPGLGGGGYPISGLDVRRYPGYPPTRSGWWGGTRGTPPTHETEQHSEHLLRDGRCTSCVHAGGLSCFK